MKKRIFGIILLIIVAVAVTVYANGDDSVVSLSYLNEVFKPQIEKTVNESMAFIVVDVKKGETFVGGSGCEFILRGGSGVIKASSLGGINDATSGADLGENTVVPANHLLIVPRDDQRGFIATQDAIIMVKGKYSIN